MFPVLVFEAIEISQKEINNCDVCRIQMSVIATGLTCGCVSLLGAIALTQSLVADGIAVTRNIPKKTNNWNGIVSVERRGCAITRNN
jgi:hypothetical protein